ncbi:MAG: hypothetical protein GY826_45070, partial [Fuerstiella sp.]|nr:hypothetical protein [Fuerstiella sp.]
MSAQDEFGAAVAINDSLLVIGAPDADGRTVDCGTAYFFRECRAGR